MQWTLPKAGTPSPTTSSSAFSRKARESTPSLPLFPAVFAQPLSRFSLDSALRYMNDYPLIPIVNRANSHQLEGVISRDSVFQKYGTRSNRN